MANPKLLALSKTILRRRASRPVYRYHCISTQSPRQFQHQNHFFRSTYSPAASDFQARYALPYSFLASRSFSSSQSEELVSLPIDFAATVGAGVDAVNEESILPVQALTYLLDGFHDITGFPWWLVIASSTLALRLTLFPFVVLQLRKLKRIGELFPKLPPPLPPPFSGRSFKDQFALFRKEKNAVGCPSFFWFIASFAVQVPLFLLWVTSIRRMSLDCHPGFDCGGIFWFQNLTEYPTGALGPIFPLLIAGLHYVNVQISFRKSSLGKVSGVFAMLAKYYRMYLEVLTIPMLFITFNIPQGALIYWLTNSSLSVCQQLLLQHPDVRERLGLPNKASVEEVEHNAIEKVGIKETTQSGGQRRVSARELSPKELVALSVTLLAKGQLDRVVEILRLALEKDPECVRAMLLMGQIFMQKNLLSEATEYLELAVSQLLKAGLPSDVEDVDLLILSSTWAGSVYMRQGKKDEGIVHLERLASLQEPEDSKSKSHYYDGLLLLSSALSTVGRKDEAIQQLRRAVAYDPDRYQQFLDQYENEEDDITSDLVSSRRTDS
ncbi:OLC1v1025813C2 [Oldenlandia corymbosa var. corymbosa]|uniref:OLC1v1025813C2 n=1 Tax=Oldenlandia corymbosa var. corymbosa TaxID=529605 RepID=A0AAV1C6A0_OLDCO|nr:OLC1v1025813C2 [Oldenlandia corymbosa var. corymbosa]